MEKKIESLFLKKRFKKSSVQYSHSGLYNFSDVTQKINIVIYINKIFLFLYNYQNEFEKIKYKIEIFFKHPNDF